MADSALTQFPLTQAPRRKLAETVAQQLLEAVRKLEPGTRIPSEKELTQMLGVGRSTVREALNGLALLGVVEIRHGQGVFVAAESSAGPADGRDEPSSMIGQALAKGVTHDLLEARQIVEVAIARLAAARRTDAEIRDIEADLEAHQRVLTTSRTPLKPASQFHVLLAEAAHNEVLAGVFHSFLKLMLDRGPLLYENVPGFAEWEIDQHRRIFEAIRAGDSELAGTLMHDHVAAMESYYKQAGEA